MEIKRIVKNEGGGVDAVVALDVEQTKFLIQFALGVLLQQGLIVYRDLSEEEYKKEQAAKPEDEKRQSLIDSMSEAMKAADPEDLPKA